VGKPLTDATIATVNASRRQRIDLLRELGTVRTGHGGSTKVVGERAAIVGFRE
jgi:hypothetical protein